MKSAEADTKARPRRRAAAQRASRLAAEQMSSSSPEDESDVPAFGAPSGRRSRVQSTRSGKQKSTLRANAAHTSLSSSSTAATTRPLRTATAPRNQNGQGKTPSVSRTQEKKPAADVISDADTDIVILSRPPSPMRKPALKLTRSEPTQGPSQRANTPPQKRKYVDETGSASEVEVLLTPRSTPSSDAWSATATGDPGRAQDTVHKTTPRTFARGPRPLGASQAIRRARTLSPPAWQSDGRYDTLDLEDDVVLVFVRLDLSGAPSESDDAMWWPAQLVDHGPPWRVAPFGTPPGARRAPLALPSAAPALLQPYRAGPARLRFSEATFAPPQSPRGLALARRKRRRTDAHGADADLVARWSEARDLLLKAHQDANDGLPLLLSHYVVGTAPRRPLAIGSSSDESDGSAGAWRAPSPNFMYDIPGELVLARDRRRDTQYWPAKIMKYHPPARREEKPLYEVLFFDGTVRKFADDEDMFFTPSHDGFRTCKLGEAQDDYGLNEDASDDEDAPNVETAIPDEETEAQLRESSPPPALPAPTAFGHELTMAEQLAYVKPVLVALMNGRHAPSRARHVGFMKRGRTMRAIVNAAGQRGELSNRDQEELSACICRWMRRRLRRQQLGLVPHDERVWAEDAGAVPASERRPERGAPVLDLDLDLELLAADDSESASSDAQLPPSSLATAESIQDTSEASGDDGGARQVATPTDATHAIEDDDRAAGTTVSKAGDPGAPSDRRDDTLRAGPLPTYAELSPLDQITYCTSVLLPEAILQLLLWRNGLRTRPELLPAPEEARLHAAAREKADATNWVHDIIRMKRAVDRTTLPAAAAPARADRRRRRKVA